MKHATPDSIEHQLDNAAKKAVVRKSDFEDFRKEQTEQHKIITDNQCATDKKIELLMPLAALADEKTVQYLKDGVELKQSTDMTINSWKGKAKTIAIFLGVIAVFLAIVNGFRDLIVSWFLKR